MSPARLLVAASLFSAFAAASDSSTIKDDGKDWSKPIEGVVAKITLTERPAINGTRSIVPYLELRNVSDVGNPLHVPCGSGHVKFELIDANGKIIRGGWGQSRSGPHADPGTIVLPFDSSIRIGMYCSNWGVPKDAAAMIATDSGAWVLMPKEKGTVFLRATVTNDANSESCRIWRGIIVTPPVRVNWSE